VVQAGRLPDYRFLRPFARAGPHLRRVEGGISLPGKEPLQLGVGLGALAAGQECGGSWAADLLQRAAARQGRKPAAPGKTGCGRSRKKGRLRGPSRLRRPVQHLKGDVERALVLCLRGEEPLQLGLGLGALNAVLQVQSRLSAVYWQESEREGIAAGPAFAAAFSAHLRSLK
jgi:hypothetical protein